MQPTVFFTKSDYRTALDCPTKLYFQSHSGEYPSKATDDPFLKALQKGGFQVGALARLYYPDGILVDSRSTQEALKATATLMRRERVVLFEAAFEWNGLLVRTDVLVKDGSRITIKEVKSKAYDPVKNPFFNKNGSIASRWKKPIYDVAFQTYVVSEAVPTAKVEAYLVLCDKAVEATVDGLNALFQIEQGDDGHPLVLLTNPDISQDELGAPLLHEADFTATVHEIIATPEFLKRIEEVSLPFLQGRRHDPRPMPACRNCEFRVPEKTLQPGERSGFDECWSDLGLTGEDLKEPLVVDIGNDFRKKPDTLSAGVYLMRDVDPKEHLSGKNASRQWLQILTATDPEQPAEHVDPALFDVMDGFTYPLHFIDFETASVAIPLFTGQRPYQNMAFQFSCHLVHEDGRIEHSHEWIQPMPARMPNIDFARALRAALGDDGGTVFRYSNHENTILNEIHELLKETSDDDAPDREELMAWIRTITHWKDGKERVEGKRCMVDQLDLVKRYYYHRDMGGSNSIKKVLPAMLGQSDVLRQAYSQPYFGTNYHEGQVWWQLDRETGRVVNPYKLLPEMEAEGDEEDEGAIDNGGAAAMAFAKMQYTGMSDEERDGLTKALLRYCELDTLAMVMIHQHWDSLRAGYRLV
ncbi:MAG TPA: DUF2779 domain-containing protein [Rhodothermales bacterium]|nr:DUF2779 domain-containing protein [Rhodothermales bacterium]